MPAFGRRVDGPGGRRAAPRAAVAKAASLVTPSQSRIASVMDLSTTGAQVQGCGDIAMGQNVWLRIGPIDAFATVVWIEGDVCGVTFDEPLCADDISDLSREYEAAMIAGLSPDERIAAENWMNNFVR